MCVWGDVWYVFVIKQKTADERRISDLSSDVCSSDLQPLADLLWRRATEGRPADTPERRAAIRAELRTQVRAIRDPELREDYRPAMARRFEAVFGYRGPARAGPGGRGTSGGYAPRFGGFRPAELGRASGRERVCPYV